MGEKIEEEVVEEMGDEETLVANDRRKGRHLRKGGRRKRINADGYGNER